MTESQREVRPRHEDRETPRDSRSSDESNIFYRQYAWILPVLLYARNPLSLGATMACRAELLYGSMLIPQGWHLGAALPRGAFELRIEPIVRYRRRMASLMT